LIPERCRESFAWPAIWPVAGAETSETLYSMAGLRRKAEEPAPGATGAQRLSENRLSGS
jgi:hypothetical protein